MKKNLKSNHENNKNQNKKDDEIKVEPKINQINKNKIINILNIDNKDTRRTTQRKFGWNEIIWRDKSFRF